MPLSKKDVEFINSEFEPNSVPEVFAIYQNKIIKALTDNLERVNRVSTGALSQSIRVDIEQEEETVSFILFMEDYWKFVDMGVDGWKNKHGSPFSYKKKNIDQQAMLDFIKFRGIRPKPPKRKGLSRSSKKLSMDKRRKQLAFVMGRSIAKKGLKPTNFFSDVVNETFKKELAKDISEALAKEVNIEFELTNKALNG
jgi:hypothetical protein